MSVTSGTKHRGIKKEHHMQRLSEQGLKRSGGRERGQGSGVRQQVKTPQRRLSQHLPHVVSSYVS